MTIGDVLKIDRTRNLKHVLIHIGEGTYSCELSELPADKSTLPVKHFNYDILRGNATIEFTVDEGSITNLFTDYNPVDIIDTVDDPSPGLSFITDWTNITTKCHKCGTTQSVRYIMTLQDPLTNNQHVDLPLCDMCASNFDPNEYRKISTEQEGLHIKNAIGEIEQAMRTIHSDTTTANYLVNARKMLQVVIDVCYSGR